MQERKAFNFYRSYYDMALELPESERLSFLMAVIEMQFTGQEPTNLTGLAKFAFTSQKHSILKQLEGYANGLKSASQGGPPRGPRQGPHRGPRGQEKGQEQEQEKEEIEIFGTHSQKFFTVQAKYLTDAPCRIYEDGLKDYCQKHLLGFWFKKDYMAELFWKENTGKMFNEHTHVSNVMIKINNG